MERKLNSALRVETFVASEECSGKWESLEGGDFLGGLFLLSRRGGRPAILFLGVSPWVPSAANGFSWSDEVGDQTVPSDERFTSKWDPSYLPCKSCKTISVFVLWRSCCISFAWGPDLLLVASGSYQLRDPGSLPRTASCTSFLRRDLFIQRIPRWSSRSSAKCLN